MSLVVCILGPFSPPNLLPINTSLCSPNVCPLFLVLSLARLLPFLSIPPEDCLYLSSLSKAQSAVEVIDQQGA